MNSIEAMEDGGYLEVITGLIQESSFSYKKEEKCVQVIIRDSGCGISVENLEKIFNPFFTTKPTGSGLGLYSADKILRDHDTCIEASSKVNEGTTMSIKFKIPL
jgi:signal transduction histidine kinase